MEFAINNDLDGTLYANTVTVLCKYVLIIRFPCDVVMIADFEKVFELIISDPVFK